MLCFLLPACMGECRIGREVHVAALTTFPGVHGEVSKCRSFQQADWANSCVLMHSARVINVLEFLCVSLMHGGYVRVVSSL